MRPYRPIPSTNNAIAFRTCVSLAALKGGWRPAEHCYPSALTAIITLVDKDGVTEYAAHVTHKNPSDRNQHNDMGFLEGRGAALTQLAKTVE